MMQAADDIIVNEIITSTRSGHYSSLRLLPSLMPSLGVLGAPLPAEATATAVVLNVLGQHVGMHNMLQKVSIPHMYGKIEAKAQPQDGAWRPCLVMRMMWLSLGKKGYIFCQVSVGNVY